MQNVLAALAPGATEEEQLAYALQLSAIESGSPTAGRTVAWADPTPAPAPARGDPLSRREEEELAVALALSLQV